MYSGRHLVFTVALVDVQYNLSLLLLLLKLVAYLGKPNQVTIQINNLIIILIEKILEKQNIYLILVLGKIHKK